jgi:hypothetical protein
MGVTRLVNPHFPQVDVGGPRPPDGRKQDARSAGSADKGESLLDPSIERPAAYGTQKPLSGSVGVIPTSGGHADLVTPQFRSACYAATPIAAALEQIDALSNLPTKTNAND